MKPTALLLCGLPFAGKSTLASALAEEGYVPVSPDTINFERGLGLGGETVHAADWQLTHGIALAKLAKLIADGNCVVWDDTNYAAWIRDPIFEAAIAAGAEPVIVFVDTPLPTVRARRDAAGAQPFPDEDFERIVRDFEPPCCGVRIDGRLPVETAVRTVRHAVRGVAVHELSA